MNADTITMTLPGVQSRFRSRIDCLLIFYRHVPHDAQGHAQGFGFFNLFSELNDPAHLPPGATLFGQ